MTDLGPIGVHGPHIFHLCDAAHPSALCGDIRPDNWLIREEWMDHLAPESICPDCLAVTRRSSESPAGRVLSVAAAGGNQAFAR